MPNTTSTGSSPRKSTNNQGRQLYDKIGGESAIKSAVRQFLSKLARDNRTSDVFGLGVDAAAQANLIAGFIGHVTGGPAYTGPSMHEFYRHLEINDSQYDAFMELLEEVLLDARFEQAAVARILSATEGQRAAVLKRAEHGSSWLATLRSTSDHIVVKASGAVLAVGLLAFVGLQTYKHISRK